MPPTDDPVISWETSELTKTIENGVVDYQLKLNIGFKDGNGDIGLLPSDTSGDFSFGSPYYYNIHVDYFEKINGEFTQLTPQYPFPIGDTIRFNGRTPILTPEGRHKAINGTIEYTLNLGDGAVKSPILKFEVWIYDRALHKSNVIESPEIILN